MSEVNIESWKEEFPPNNPKMKEESEKNKPLVDSSKVTVKKKSSAKNLREQFLGDDARTVVDYVVYDIVIPAAKELLSNVVTKGVEMMLFGSDRANNVDRVGGRSYVNYSRMYDKPYREPVRAVSRNMHDFDEYTFADRSDAERVLDHLYAELDDYGQVSVSEFYTCIGKTCSHVDQRWGWTNLGGAYVDSVRGGYVVRLPRCKVIYNR